MERPEAHGRYQIPSLHFHLYHDAEAALAAFAAREVTALGAGGARESLLALPSSQVYTQARLGRRHAHLQLAGAAVR